MGEIHPGRRSGLGRASDNVGAFGPDPRGEQPRVDDRQMGGDHGGVAGNLYACPAHDATIAGLVHVGDGHVFENVDPAIAELFDEPGGESDWVEVGLVGERDGADDRQGQLGAGDELDRQTRRGGGGDFGLDCFETVGGDSTGVRGGIDKIAVDMHGCDPIPEAGEGSDVGRGVRSRRVATFPTDQPVVDEAVQGGQFGGAVTGSSSRDSPGVNDCHRRSVLDARHRRTQPGQTSTDHDNVDTADHLTRRWARPGEGCGVGQPHRGLVRVLHVGHAFGAGGS